MKVRIDSFALMWFILIILKAYNIVSVGWLWVVFFPVWLPAAIIGGTIALILAIIIFVAIIAAIFLVIMKICDL